MRLYNNDVFNYPVLKAVKDDYSTTFQVEVEVKNEMDRVLIYYTIQTDSQLLLTGLKNNTVEVYIHLYARNFMFRKLERLKFPKGSIELLRDEVFKELEVTPLVLAKCDFTLDINTEATEKEDKFEVEKNTIIGFNETLNLKINQKKSKLEDFVVVRPTPTEELENKIDLEDDRVIYYMSEQEYEAFSNIYKLNSVKADLYTKNIHLSLYMRMLMQILHSKNGEEEDIKSTNWYNMIEEKLINKNLELDKLELTNISKYAYELTDISYVELQKEIGE